MLISEIAKDSVGEEDLVEAFKQKDPKQRAEMVLRWAARIGCRRFVTADDVVAVSIHVSSNGVLNPRRATQI